AILIGAFQRPCDAPSVSVQRGTGGAAVRVGPGTLHVMVAAPTFDEDESVILNRMTRPLLRALRARYFGRDWIDVDHHPIAHVGFAHERATRRTVFEAFVAVRTPFALGDRPSYLGKIPATLEELRGKIDDDALVQSILDAYGYERRQTTSVSAIASASVKASWATCVDEAIGRVCAGPDDEGRFRIGGELMASFDAVRDFEDRVARHEDAEEAADAAFTAPHTALFGVRSLRTFAMLARQCAENP
ncbi:MAG TPA: hypothetical protein VH054_01170, partial [Polyangiaceae bacterium]|nr:hypothetical protein [Polyangiaceae bacterium]